jgi:pilus assembly protein CpaF
MSLYKRLHEEDGPIPNGRRNPAQDEFRQRIHLELIQKMGPALYDKRISEDELRSKVTEHLTAALAKERLPLSIADEKQLIQDVTDDILGFGPVEQYLRDPDVTEVMVNGPKQMYIERHGKLEPVSASFADETHLRRIIDKIVSLVGRRIDEATPMVDARLPDGSRVNAIIHPLAVGGPYLTIRKFSSDPFQVEDLIRFGTLNDQAAHFLDSCVRGRLNIVVSGGTGTGKTTLLNVLSSFIPATERIVTIEDAKELQLHQDHILSLESRPPNIEGRGEVTIRDLVRNALRMRPDRVVVGECRAGEALDMLQAMNTGHDGSLTSIHANTPRDALARVETMTLMSGFDLPVRAIREQMSAALDLIVHLARFRDGTRRVTQITEVEGMEGDTVVLQDIFMFDYGMGVDEDGRVLGHLKPTGLRPRFADRLKDMGIILPADIFHAEIPLRRPSVRR